MTNHAKIMTIFSWPALCLSLFATNLSFSSLSYAQTTEAEQAMTSKVNLTANDFFEDQRNNTITATGDVEAVYDGRLMRADKAIYNRTTERLHAIGNVVLTDPDGTQRFADEFEVTNDLQSGYAVNFSIRLADGGRAVAKSAIRTEDGTDVLDNVVYTACEVCDGENPTWALRSQRAQRSENSGLITYQNTIVEIGGVPVFYAPFLAHPDPSIERQSGLLFPDIGLSSKLGTYYQQPVFYAISQSADILVSPLIASQVNPMVETRFRKRFWSGNLDIRGSFTNEYEFDSSGDQIFFDDNGLYIEDPDNYALNKTASEKKFRGHVYANGLFDINDNWKWGFGVENQTDAFYNRRYGIEGLYELRGLYYSQGGRLLSQLFTQGQGENFYAEASTFGFQDLIQGVNNDFSPKLQPLIYATKDYNLGAFGDVSVDFSSANITRSLAPTSARNSVGARWQKHSVIGGALITPFIEGRVDRYKFDTDFSAEPDKNRMVGSVGANVSYPLIKYTPKATYTIVPELLVAHSSANANDPIIPNEDAASTELNWASLMLADGKFGYDVFEGDSKAAINLKAAAHFNNGMQIETRLGRRWRSRADSALTGVTNLDGTVSDWMVNTNLNLGEVLNLSADVRLDDETLEPNRVDLSGNTKIGPISAKVNYYKVEDGASLTGNRSEGVKWGGRLSITQRISANYLTLRDIALNQNYIRTYGLTYEDDCAIFQIYYRTENFDTAIDRDSSSVGFTFTLKTLGTFGSTQFD